MKKNITGIYFILLGICTVLLLAGLILGKTNVISRVESLQKKQIYPVREIQLTEDLKAAL